MKTLKPSVHTPEPGWLGLEVGENLNWYKCREEFSNNFTVDRSGFYFCHRLKEGRKTSLFMQRTEEIIQVPFSLFSDTERDDVIYVEPSAFWMDCWMKRQVLSIFLRASANYDPEANNYEEALFKPDIMDKNYAWLTRKAISRFLFGFTQFIPEVPPLGFYSGQNGWVTVFKDKTIQEIKRILVSPQPVESLCFDCNSLWS